MAPPRLGTSFRYLLSASWVNQLGDGIALAAGPLLVASLTDSEFLVALAALFAWLPPFLFALPAGALSDRLDRKRIIVVVNVVRIVVLGVLVGALLTDRVSIGLVLGVLLALGTAEVFGDNTSSTLLPMIVDRDDLATANSRLMVGFVTVNQFAGPPLGALLFGLGSAVPFLGQAVLLAFALVLIGRIALPQHRRKPDQHLWGDVVEGCRWAVRHAAVRTLIITIFIFNLTYGAAWSVLVLYVTRHLGMGEIGFGLVTSVLALGGLAGNLAYGWITRYVALGDLMRVGLIVETLTHLALALVSTAWLALPVFFLFGAHAFIWGTTSITVRQRAVPSGLQGRVNSVNTLGTYGGLVFGAGIGGVLAERWGVLAPYWFGFVGSAVFVVLIWRQLAHVQHADEHPVITTAG